MTVVGHDVPYREVALANRDLKIVARTDCRWSLWGDNQQMQIKEDAVLEPSEAPKYIVLLRKGQIIYTKLLSEYIGGGLTIAAGDTVKLLRQEIPGSIEVGVK